MKLRALLGISVSVLLLAGLVPLGSKVTAAPTRGNPSFLMPLYDASSADWATACSDLGNSSSFTIADIGNPGGPGTAKSASWATNIGYCGSAKTGVLGYVDTSFCQIPLATVESQVGNWYSWYAANGVNGIFFDEANNPANPAAITDCLSGTMSAITYYQTIAAYVHAKATGQTVTFNFGVNPVSNWPLSSGVAANNADITVVFEDPYSDYVNYGGSGAWKQAAWEANYAAKKLSLLVYSGSGTKQPATFCSAALKQNVGYVYITPNSGWTTLPGASYLNAELSSC